MRLCCFFSFVLWCVVRAFSVCSVWCEGDYKQPATLNSGISLLRSSVLIYCLLDGMIHTIFHYCTLCVCVFQMYHSFPVTTFALYYSILLLTTTTTNTTQHHRPRGYRQDVSVGQDSSHKCAGGRGGRYHPADRSDPVRQRDIGRADPGVYVCVCRCRCVAFSTVLTHIPCGPIRMMLTTRSYIVFFFYRTPPLFYRCCRSTSPSTSTFPVCWSSIRPATSPSPTCAAEVCSVCCMLVFV